MDLSVWGMQLASFVHFILTIDRQLKLHISTLPMTWKTLSREHTVRDMHVPTCERQLASLNHIHEFVKILCYFSQKLVPN